MRIKLLFSETIVALDLLLHLMLAGAISCVHGGPRGILKVLIMVTRLLGDGHC